MLKWIESTGKSEEAAIEAALQKLGMDRDEVSVEILERAKSGFLGIGSCPAKVKVSYEAPDEPEERPAPAEVTPAEAEPVKAAEPAVREEAPSPRRPCGRGGEGGAHRRLSHRPAGPDGGRGQTRHPDG